MGEQPARRAIGVVFAGPGFKPALLALLTFFCALLLAAPARVRAQTCCGRLDLPLAASQRGANRERELLLGAFYEYDRLAHGAVADGFGTVAITSHRLVLTATYGVARWLTPELSTALTARLIDQRIADRSETRSLLSPSDTPPRTPRATALGIRSSSPAWSSFSSRSSRRSRCGSARGYA